MILVDIAASSQDLNIFENSSAQLIYFDKPTGHFVVEGEDFSVWDNDKALVIQKPHQDLLPAFLNLKNPSPLQPDFLISSPCLKSLMSFYQILIEDYNFKAAEIIKRGSDDLYMGLLVKGREGYTLPENIKDHGVSSNTIDLYKI